MRSAGSICACFREPERASFGTDEEHGPRCCTGTILSSNLFTTAPDLLHDHRCTLLGDCKEMEDAAAAQLSARAGTPFLAVRSISNVCGEGYSELNDAGARMEKAARLAAKIVLGTIGIYASGDSPAS